MWEGLICSIVMSGFCKCGWGSTTACSIVMGGVTAATKWVGLRTVTCSGAMGVVSAATKRWVGLILKLVTNIEAYSSVMEGFLQQLSGGGCGSNTESIVKWWVGSLK